MNDLHQEWAVAERLAVQAEDRVNDVLRNQGRPSLETQRIAIELRLKADRLFQLAFKSQIGGGVVDPDAGAGPPA